MTQTTTTITRTAYDVYVTDGCLSCNCTMGKRMDGTFGLAVDGNLTIKDEAIKAAVIAMLDAPKGTKQVIVTGTATDNTAELDAYDKSHAAVVKAMSY